MSLSKHAPAAYVTALVLCLWHWGTDQVQLSHYGDDQEYLTMATSFMRHASPDFRAGDDTAMLEALPGSFQRSLGKKFTRGQAPFAYFASHSGKYYGYHFFTYPAAVAPLRAVLEGRQKAFRAHQYFNLIALSIALASLLLLASQPHVFWPTVSMAFLTPVLWFTTYASTETFVFSLGLLALACHLSGRPVLAILFNSIAATQYQPLALLSLFLCAQWFWVHRSGLRQAWLRALGALASTALVFVPSIFFYTQFGVPNLIAREGLASAKFMSFRKFVGLFIDLNGGMLLYAPGLLLMSAVATVWAISRARRHPWGLGLCVCVLLTLAASTVQRNWNHPTFGISRYVLYAIAPALLFIGGELRERARVSRWLVGLCAFALGLQVLVHRENGWFAYRANDAAHHSRIAAYVIERWPWLYSPHSEIFCERTTQWCWPDPATGDTDAAHLPVVYRDPRTWMARKMLVSRCDEAKALAVGLLTDEQRAHIHEAMQHCSGTGPMYINF